MKSYSSKFWIVFWLSAAVFLFGWFLFWSVQHNGSAYVLKRTVDLLPLSQPQKKQYQTLATVGDFLLKKDNQEKTILVLFQNNMEIRPGGGFIGAFGIVKFKNGKVTSMENHDLSNFDARIPNVLTAPYPIGEIMRVASWKMRDSNFSPDFAINAAKAQEFYYLGKGEEKFDGVIGITSDVLTSMLKVTGPIEIEGYPGRYDSESAILTLEYQVEKAFEEQGIDKGERKSIMSELADEIEKRVFALSIKQKIQLAKLLLADLNQKDIQLNFKDVKLQKLAEEVNWAGRVDQNWSKDFLMVVDANLGSFKSDYYVKRAIDYSVDLSGSLPKAKLKITYEHTAKQKDWMTRDYTDYLRVYVPRNAELIDQQNFDGTKIDEEFGKKYFGAIVRVPIGTSKTVEINYSLPMSAQSDYGLKIQKQAGLNNVPVDFKLIRTNGRRDGFAKIMNGDIVFE